MCHDIITQCQRIASPAFVFLLFITFSCDSGGDLPSWTVMFYGNGDNNLEHYIVGDFLEMQRAKAFGTSLTVVSLIDRVPEYSILDGDWTDTRLYELKYISDSKVEAKEISCEPLGLTVENSEELNLGDWRTLAAFVDWATNKYSSDFYVLIVGGHGSGWLPFAPFFSISPDSTSMGSSISLSNIRQALEDKGIHVLVLDSCLMGEIEVAYELRNCAQYLVASPSNAALNGYDYQIMLESFQKRCTSPRECALAFVEGYALSNPNIAAGMYAYDVRKISDIVDSGLIDDFAEHLIALGAEEVKSFRRASLSYRYGSKNVYVDLADFAKLASFVKLTEALREAIGGKDGDVKISIYYPESSFDYLSSYHAALDFTQKTNWDEYLAWYYRM
ncbi:MAG: clostripain-related cysteine peptidase [Spirochaetes bacterium]|nr:clostripain-related cysteine peptidase [Spirochaetota bacterium]